MDFITARSFGFLKNPKSWLLGGLGLIGIAVAITPALRKETVLEAEEKSWDDYPDEFVDEVYPYDSHPNADTYDMAEVEEQYLIWENKYERPDIREMMRNTSATYTLWQRFSSQTGITDANTIWRIVHNPWKWEGDLLAWANDEEIHRKNAEDWGGDPDGPLAKALAKARAKSKEPRKPLKIEKLPHRDQKSLQDFEAETSLQDFQDAFFSAIKPRNAVAVLAPNDNGVAGVVHFTQEEDTVHIDYDITGLTDGEHGFHIHTYGDLTDGCDSACSHFNPDNTEHGGLDSKIRHLGDLGNISSEKGVSKGRLSTDTLSLKSGKRNSIVGRMIIVHADRDDLGKGGDAESLKTGNAGKRVGCGVIGLAKDNC